MSNFEKQSPPEKTQEGQFIFFPKTSQELITQVKKTTSDSLVNAKKLIDQLGLTQNTEAIQALNEFQSTAMQAAAETGMEETSQNTEKQAVLSKAQKLVKESEQLGPYDSSYAVVVPDGGPSPRGGEAVGVLVLLLPLGIFLLALDGR